MEGDRMKNFVNLNVNPCKMCMPMGSISAFYGVSKCMTILHGSQGCATYIRRHMATHYNEPIDVASSSLTEEGAVFGGEKNLVKGLDNLIKLYDPDVIGVSTTCLAETIGEDTAGIVARYCAARPELRAKIVTVQSAGYAGTQFEGFFRTLRALVEQTEPDASPNGKINIVTNMISPADTRWLKGFVAQLGVDAIFLPDLSENLDGAHADVYERLPAGGTPLSEIARMAGARATVELSTFYDESYSPGQYLYDNYGVPLHRLALPVSLADMDALADLLATLRARPDAAPALSFRARPGIQKDAEKTAGSKGKPCMTAVPELEKERGRRLDAMVDSHKHNAQVRAAVFGEPDFVYAACRLLVENGALPAVVATGSVCPSFKERITEAISGIHAFHLGENPYIQDDCDFTEIEAAALEQRVNVLVGSSDGRRISEKTGIPLVRCAFPVHDYVGGQRVRTLGYEGGLALLDQITNAVIAGVEGSFRGELRERYYHGAPADARGASGASPIRVMRPAGAVTAGAAGMAGTAGAAGMAEAVEAAEAAKGHPCFCGCGNARAARIHLPVAASCNIQCGYCVRKYDCVNESRPGVTSGVLTPEAALERYLIARETIENLNVVGIAGPGDALADPAPTLETLRLVREADPDVLFCLSTNGLALPEHIDALAALGLTHLTVTVNAVDPAIGARIYRHVDYRGLRLVGEAGAAALLANQFAGLARAKALGLQVKVNTVLLPGVNDAHIPEIMAAARDAGCVLSNIMPMIPVPGSALAHLGAADFEEVERLRAAAEELLPQMRHCAHCRADAAGPLGKDVPLEDAPAREARVAKCAG
jgi:nitrogenase molybdenum-iron protein alpha/beta subunit/MoaA/NifB/PqqE/SkfB family radical SAM enzyme